MNRFRGSTHDGLTWPRPGRSGAVGPGGGLLLLAVACVSGCGDAAESSGSDFPPSSNETAFIDTLQVRTFRYFWDLCNPQTGLAPDRAPTESFASVAATGFALTAYPIGVERGYVSRDGGRATGSCAPCDFFWTARQDTARPGASGLHGLLSTISWIRTPGPGSAMWSCPPWTPPCCWPGPCSASLFRSDRRPTRTRIRALADSLYLSGRLAMGLGPAAHHRSRLETRGGPPALRLAAATTRPC